MNEVKVVVSGQYKAGPAFSALDRDVAQARKSTEQLGSQGVGRAESALESFKGAVSTGSAVLGGLGIAAAGVTRVLGDGIAVSLRSANAEVALGEKGFATLTAAAEANANVMGFTESEFIGTAGAAASLAKNLGFSQESAARLGAAFPDLADKLVTLSNGQVTASESADMLRSAMAGEYDPLQAVGIAINAAAVETAALAIQQRSSTAITKEQATAMAVLEIVQRQTADASKVMATEAGRAAADAQRAQAELKQAYEELSEAAVPVLRDLTQGTANLMQSWKDAVGGGEDFGDRLEGIMKVAAPLTNLVDAVTDSTEEQGEASKQTALDIDGLAEGAQGAAKSQEQLAEETKEATDAIRDQAGVALDGREAARQWEESIDAASESLKTNRRTLDNNTEAGRANNRALDDMAEAAFDVADAVVAAGGSEKDYRASLSRSREALVRQARQFGMTADEAENYASEVLGIPARVRTTVSSNLGQQIGLAKNLRAQMSAIDGATIGYYIGVSGAGVGALAGFAHGGPVGAVSTAAAGGGRNGLTWVGENGPELVNMAPGSMVHTAANSRTMARQAAGGAGGMIVLNVNIAGRRVGQALIEPLRGEIVDRGGDVQVVLGSSRGSR